jgi:hypothetical protein
VVRAAARADGELLERTEAGRRLARVEDRRVGPSNGLDVAARQRGDAGQTAEQVERRSFSGEKRTRVARDTCDRPFRNVAVMHDALERDAWVELAEYGLRDIEPAGDAFLLQQDRDVEPCVGRDDGVGREVAVADVLREEAANVDSRQLHGSSSGCRPGRRTVCSPANAALSVGKSSRK